MPPQRASESTSKKSTREKTGCYTCRIRRKKCDEKISVGDDGRASCTTCRRLRIECLEGFGQKRSKGLKNRELIKTIKTTIKNHLNNQGLVKGIARPRSLTHGPDFLELSPYLTSGELHFQMDDPGSPASAQSETSSGSSGFELEVHTNWPFADDQHRAFAEIPYEVPVGMYDENHNETLSSLDPWYLPQSQYQQAQDPSRCPCSLYPDVTCPMCNSFS